MQAEIEALLRAYQTDKDRESKMIMDLLTALAVSAANRQRLLDDFAKAVTESRRADAGQAAPQRASQPQGSDELSRAVDGLRRAAAAPAAH